MSVHYQALAENTWYLLKQGGWVMVAIYVAGQTGWYFVVERWWHYQRHHCKVSELLRNPEKDPVVMVRRLLSDRRLRGVFREVVQTLAESRIKGRQAMVSNTQEVLQVYAERLNRHLNTIAVLAAIARGKPVLDRFADWQERLPAIDGRTKSHCDVVVSVDRKTLKIESIGGNVMQSVTRRQLMINESGLLSRRHYVSAPQNRKRPGTPCAEDPTCEKSDLNQQHWSVLLQLK